MPNASEFEPNQPECLSDDGLPKCRKSSAKIVDPGQARLRGSDKLPEVVRSVAGSGETDPKQARPYNSAVAPGRERDRENIDASSRKKSDAGALRPGRPELRNNRRASEWL